MSMPELEVEFDERFDGDTLDQRRWVPYYLPHWSTRDRAAARYEMNGGRLHLLIEADQPAWCPELDGDLRVSSIQTGLIAGPPGSSLGTHPFDPPGTVKDGPHDVRLYTPTRGRFKVRMTASDDPRLMVAFWMIGLGATREQSGEICVVEIFGRDVSAGSAKVGVGVKRQFDPALAEDFEQVSLPIDATEMHDYAAAWRPERVDFFVDGHLVKTVAQALDYPMTLMLGIYEFPPEPGDLTGADAYPRRFVVEHVRGYRFLP